MPPRPARNKWSLSGNSRSPFGLHIGVCLAAHIDRRQGRQGVYTAQLQQRPDRHGPYQGSRVGQQGLNQHRELAIAAITGSNQDIS